MYNSNLYSILDAVRKDDVIFVIMYLSTYQELFEAEVVSKITDQNPFLVACKLGKHRCAEEIAKRYPQVLRLRNEEGYSALHFACSRNDLPLVELLLNLDSSLCFEKDTSSMVPLQTATVFGYTDIIRTLIAARPESVRIVTPQKESLFHLAAKYFQCDAFKVLFEEVRKQKQEYLLHQKDRQGNNVIHIAASNKLIEIVKLLLPQSNTDRVMMRVNTLNKRGLTALDLYYQSSKDISTREIGRILCEAGALEARSLRMKAYIRWTLEIKSVILVVLGVITGAAFTTVCNLPKSFIEDGQIAQGGEFQVLDILFGGLPSIFYLMVCNTAILLVCMIAIIVLLWWLPFRPVVLFLTISIEIVYGLLVNGIMPKFWLVIGGVRILSCSLIAIFSLVFIGIGAIIYYAISYLFRFAKWVIRKIRDIYYVSDMH